MMKVVTQNSSFQEWRLENWLKDEEEEEEWT